MDTDKLYFVIFVIIIIALLYNTKTKKRDNLGGRYILLETSKQIYYIKPAVCRAYLLQLKDNIEILYKNFDTELYSDLKPYIIVAEKDLDDFIKVSIDEIDKEKKAARMKLHKDYRSDNDDEDISIVDIVLKIDAIIELLAYYNHEKALNLSNIHKLMRQMSENRKKDIVIADEPEMYITPELYDISGQEMVVDFLRKTPIRKTPHYSIMSQDASGFSFGESQDAYVNEMETPLYIQPELKNKSVNSLMSNDFLDSSDYIMNNRNNNKLRRSFNIDKLKEEMRKKKALTTDLNFARSLRNDYDFLDA